MTVRLVIPSDLNEARDAEQALLEEVARHGYSEAATFAIQLALEEGLNNAIRHGNSHDRRKVVKLGYQIDAERVVITIADQGGGFDPDSIPDPTADENLEKPCGRGVMLMRAYMDEVRYNQTGNQVCMVKRNS